MMKFHVFSLEPGDRFKIVSQPRTIYRVEADGVGDQQRLLFYGPSNTPITGAELFLLNGESFFVQLVVPAKEGGAK